MRTPIDCSAAGECSWGTSGHNDVASFSEEYSSCSAVSLRRPNRSRRRRSWDRLGTGEAITGLLALLVGAVIAMVGYYVLERAAESVVLVARKRLTRQLLSLSSARRSSRM